VRKIAETVLKFEVFYFQGLAFSIVLAARALSLVRSLLSPPTSAASEISFAG
jgi:hypothetical protein